MSSVTDQDSGPLNAVPLRIVIGVGGGIAAFKAAHLVRFFKEAGHDVHVIPTESALNFVGRPTFEALSGNPVSTTVWDNVDSVQHVRLGQEADLIVVAPATADLMARLAHGRADDLLTASCLVATCPVVIAPAMHTEMWEHPATRENVATLRRHGTIVLEPAHGRLTGKDTGAGRMPEPDHIGTLSLAALRNPLGFNHSLAGRRVVVTAGGTHESLDPVRYLGNASSGRQGYAIADMAAQRGAHVHLIAAHTEDLQTPSGAQVTRVSSALELKAAVDKAAQDADVVIMAAAVADFRPATKSDSKMKKNSSDSLETIELTENPDILAGLVSQRKEGTIAADTLIVGFAAETGDATASPLEHAKAKFLRKGCDLLMANAVGEGKVFGQDHSAGWLLSNPEGSDSVDGLAVKEIASGHKLDVAGQILDEVGHLTSS